MRPSLIAALLLAAAAFPAAAQPTDEPPPPPPYSALYQHCLDEADGRNPDMRLCMREERGRWDTQLNRTYQRLMARLPGGARERLRREERAWLRATRTRCEHAGDHYMGGTLQQVEIDACYLAETARRALALRARR